MMLVIEGDTAYEANETITIQTAVGPETIGAKVRNGLAVHPDGFDTVKGRTVARFAVTHVRSGLQLMTTHGYYPAVTAVDTLLRSGLVWGVDREHLPMVAVRQAIADAKGDAERYLRKLDKFAV